MHSKRQELNRKIIDEISKYNELYPCMRFHQILHNLRISISSPVVDSNGMPIGGMIGEDLYNEEPKKTLMRMGVSLD